MYKCFRFLGCFGLAATCAVSYGTPYPSLDDVKKCLCPKGGADAVTVTEIFKSVCESKHLKLIGEANGALTLPGDGMPERYNPRNYRDWQWKFDTIYGFFSCTVQGVSVFNGKTLRKAVKASERNRSEKNLTRSDRQRVAKLAKVCRVLLSETFAKKFLTEPLLQALYDNKDAAYSCFDVTFSPDACKENVFYFYVMYSQTVKEEKRKEKGASVFAVRFHFRYDLEECKFVGEPYNNLVSYSPQMEFMTVNGFDWHPSLYACLNFNESSMERIWRHPYWDRENREGKEKISGKGKDVFEGQQGNSEKSEKGLGLKEEKADPKVYTGEVKKGRSTKCDPNKRPRPPASKGEPSEKIFKKKKK